MIPKIIHYCWFGKGEKSELSKKCVASWKQYCPDYEIIEWNEDNFDFSRYVYTAEAFNCKKWAFVSDFVRLYVLYHYGGFYMDTDVELVKSLDTLLPNGFTSGWETKELLQTAFVGAPKHDRIVKALLDEYISKKFLTSDGIPEMIPNTHVFTEVLKKFGLKINGQGQTSDYYRIYARDVFSPKKPGRQRYRTTAETIAVHHFEGSWYDHTIGTVIKLRCSPVLGKLRTVIIYVIGEKNFKTIRGK